MHQGIHDVDAVGTLPQPPAWVTRECHARLAIALILMLAGRPVAFGATADIRMGALAATCAACHGTDGAALRGFATPPLAGLPPAYFVAQMRAFRDGSRPATVMNQIAKGFTAAQTESLAEYFAPRADTP